MRTSKWLIAVLVVAALLNGCGGERERMQIGVHVQKCDYAFTEEGMLAEAKDLLGQLGADGVGLNMGPDYAVYYPELRESGVSSLVELAQSAPFKALFDGSFSVYSITAYAFANGLDEKWEQGIEGYDIEAAHREIRALCDYLLQTYGDTNKTFIIKNWEGDWHLSATAPERRDPSPEEIAHIRQWLQRRIDAVADARKAVGTRTTMKLYSAVEFNHYNDARNGRPRMLNEVIPHLNADLYSFSSWDALHRPHHLIDMLNYIAKLAPDSPAFGNRNIMIGEFGEPDRLEGKEMMLHLTLEAARTWGTPYCFFWQLYDNECDRRTVTPGNIKTLRAMRCRGFWLIDRFGKKTPSWDLLQRFIASTKSGDHRYEDIYAGQ